MNKGSPRFSAKATRKAIQALSPLSGNSSLDVLIYVLERQGFEMRSDRETYALAQVEHVLQEIFSIKTGSILFTHVTKVLFKSE